MNKSFLNKIKRLLVSQKDDIMKQSVQEVTIDVDGDETDEIQGNILIDLNNQLNTRNMAKLSQIELALKKIDESTYGLCQDCGEAIPEKRLLSNPHFQTCVSCAEEREKEEKRKR